MNPRPRSDFGYVVTMLANQLKPETWYGEDGGPRPRMGSWRDQKIVFLLGAGCSRQYGLPSFHELLKYFWQDCYHSLPDSSWSFEMLRDRLDQYWQAQGPEARQRVLRFYLNRIQGRDCPGYLRLAGLASRGKIKAIVNMNFDTLLEDALDAEGVQYQVSTSFTVDSDHQLMIYKPHGSIGPVGTQKTWDRLVRSLDRLIGTVGQEKTEHSDGDRASFEKVTGDLLDARKQLHEIRGHAEAAGDLVAKAGDILACLHGGGAGSLASLRADLAQVRHRLTTFNHRESVHARNDLILDIANSDLFSNPEEQKCAQDLLTRYDVVSIGYSGVDAKISAALRAFPQERDARDKKLFVINVSRPDPRLLLVMAERASQDLFVIGEDAAFENFMEFLEKAVHGTMDFDSPTVSALSENLSFMTRCEREALAECLRLALSIRSEINVADRSSVGIEQHGRDIYKLCLDLANAAGDCLTPPEKYLLHAAAFLHDLGYFAAYSSGNVLEYPGWRLLNCHGFKTKELIEQRMESPGFVSIIPSTYSDHTLLNRCLLDICQYHATYEDETIGELAKRLAIRVSGREVSVRPRLLHALFAAAEDLAMEHPFLPSPDPVILGEESRWVIDDPVLDLFLRRKKDEVVFRIERGRVIGRTREQSSKKALWLLNMASRFVERYARFSEGWKGRRIEFVCDPPRRMVDILDYRERRAHVAVLLAEALEEELKESLRRVQRDAQCEVGVMLAEVGQRLAKLRGDIPPDRSLLHAMLASAEQSVESARHEISTEWIGELRTSFRAVRKVLDGFLTDHREIFRTAAGQIVEQETKSMHLLLNRIPELVLDETLLRLAAIDGAIRAVEPLGEPSLEELAVLMETLDEAVRCFDEEKQRIRMHWLQPCLTGVSEGLAALRRDLSSHGLSQIARQLEQWIKCLQGPRSPEPESANHDLLAEGLDAMERFLRQTGERSWQPESTLVIACLVQALRRREWLGDGIDPCPWDELEKDLRGAWEQLSGLRKRLGAPVPDIARRLEETRKLLGEARERVQAAGIRQVAETLERTSLLLEGLPVSELTEPMRRGLVATRRLLDLAKRNLERPSASSVSSILDLLAIYTFPLDGQLASRRERPGGERRKEFDEPEPRVLLSNRTVASALAWTEKAAPHPSNVVLDSYLRLRGRCHGEPEGAMEEAFRQSFDLILYPAWRFFARNWHDGIESILMALACFDLGSSRFRSEAVGGIRHLLSRQVVTWGRSGRWAYGHHECTLCTSRLLYVLSHARRLFPREDLRVFAINSNQKTLDKTVGGLLQYFLDRTDNAAWPGLGCSTHSQIQSPDYLAWAARSVTFCLAVDRELVERTGEEWLCGACGLGDRKSLLRLLTERWSHLLGSPPEFLLGSGAEEPHSYIFGQVAITCLELQRMAGHIEAFPLDQWQSPLAAMASKLGSKADEIGTLSQLSRFYIWPVLLFLDRMGREDLAIRAVDLCRECIESPIWIKDGADAGSWGFNVKNTQAVAISLLEFWRYVLADEERRKRFAALFEQERRDSREAREGRRSKLLFSLDLAGTPPMPALGRRSGNGRSRRSSRPGSPPGAA